MNNPNPFVPKGSLLEQHSKRRSRMKLGVFCVLAVSVAGLMAMLIQGCKRETAETESNRPPMDTNMPAIDTNVPPMEASNPPITVPEATNPPVVIAPTPVPPATPATTEYAVVKGDTLGKIARRNGVTLKALEAANPDVQPTRLKVGQKLAIPAPANGGSVSSATGTSATGETAGGEEFYTVKSGDTLTRIARNHGTTVKAIIAENNLITTKIKVGQKLKIPSSAAAASAPVTAPALAPAAPVTPPVSTGATEGQ